MTNNQNPSDQNLIWEVLNAILQFIGTAMGIVMVLGVIMIGILHLCEKDD